LSKHQSIIQKGILFPKNNDKISKNLSWITVIVDSSSLV
jgi:hypothetical protein